MATTNPNTPIDRTAEVCALAWQLYDDNLVDGYEDALRKAERHLDALLTFAVEWDAQAEADPELPAANNWTDEQLGDLAALLTPEAADALDALLTDLPAPEPVYIPSALEPHEQRAVDKAIFERARGIVPQLVGRFWFVPSRTTGGTVYRVTPDSCTCEAFTHGRLCWHRCLIGLEHELAA